MCVFYTDVRCSMSVSQIYASILPNSLFCELLMVLAIYNEIINVIHY